jgi:outer membrane protein TolC
LASDERIPGNHRDAGVKEEVGQATEGSQVKSGIGFQSVLIPFLPALIGSPPVFTNAPRRLEAHVTLACLLFIACACLGCRSGTPFKPQPPTFAQSAATSAKTLAVSEASRIPAANTSGLLTKSQVARASYQEDATSNESSRRAEILEKVDLDEADDKLPIESRDEQKSETDESAEPALIATQKEASIDETTQINPRALRLQTVLSTTVDYYPEIRSVLQESAIAQAEQLQAQGGFDTKLKASSENTPVGFYETYRSKFGIEQPTFNGGSLFAGYRFGRGDIEPWYLERNTNELGELKLGANWALLRGRQIDARRVAIWQADLKRSAVDPVIQQQLLFSLRDAEIAYWNWVAAGQVFKLNEKLLEVAKNRVNGIDERIKAGDLPEITRTDNDRSILSREVKLIKARAKLEQAAVKLSLYNRDANGLPLIPAVTEIPELEDSKTALPLEDISGLIASAITCRPELNLICLDIKKISLDISKARNDLLPQLNAQVAVSQDFGDPTSASAVASSSTQTLFVNFDEKDEFQVDASLFLSQSLQRRKPTGKIRALSSKLQQLQIKQKFLEEKIEAEVRQNYQLTAAASQQAQVAAESLELARRLSSASRERLEDGDVDLFEIILREQQELDSAGELIGSRFNFFANRANLNASIGCEPGQFLDR